MTHVLKTQFGDGLFDIPTEGKVAVAASGGADSTLTLIYLLQHGCIPNLLFLDNTSASFDALTSIVDKIKNMMQIELSLETVPRKFAGHWIDPDLAFLKDKSDYVFYGTTKNPDASVLSSDVFKFAGEPPMRITRAEISSSIFNLPFIDVDKRAIIAAYKQFNLLDVYALTHSCTHLKDAHCGKCFACSERKWAEKENDVCLTIFLN